MQKHKKQYSHRVEQEIDQYTEEDRQIDMVNIDCINCNAKSQGIIEKLRTSSYQNSVNISYKMDTVSNSNIFTISYTQKFCSLGQQKKLLS